jgi:small GTP-binding protein
LKENVSDESQESRRLVVGVLAHADAGKTTLSEGLLYLSGYLRKLGRVDHRNTFLDTYAMERDRGITIFSKQARFSIPSDRGRLDITLLDTPGHTDFSAETERTLQVLDYAILVISGTDGVQNHTLTLWQLLKTYQIPVFLFINKMDLPGTDIDHITKELREKLDEGCFPFYPDEPKESLGERLAMTSDHLLNDFLTSGSVDFGEVALQVAQRKLFPCWFGSALRMDGIDRFMQCLASLTLSPIYSDHFGARVYKISHEGTNRLTYLKITGGSLSVRDEIRYLTVNKMVISEKISQIRLYSGDSYSQVDHVSAGDICAVSGLSATYVGQGLGEEPDAQQPILEPVLNYCLRLPEGLDEKLYFSKFKQLEEEDPSLHLIWQEELQEIHARLMGDVQIDVLKQMIWDRFHLTVEVDEGKILYKETIQSPVEGIGHFEPLRHYAEVHLLLEPLPEGSGIVLESGCPESILDRNWQRLILSGLSTKTHRGVLMGAPLTDVKIRLLCGRASLKHTDGGDFRQAAWRAVRQGLMKARSVLLEPWYRYTMELPTSCIGRAMTDLQSKSGEFTLLEGKSPDTSCLKGRVPVSEFKNYSKELVSYTGGRGHLLCLFDGYAPCHNQDEILAATSYDPVADTENSPDSVFCAHGAGFIVPWNEVPRYMHMDSGYESNLREKQTDLWNEQAIRYSEVLPSVDSLQKAYHVSEEEMAAILNRQFGSEKRKQYKEPTTYGKKESSYKTGTPKKLSGNPQLIIDGYNLIFQWDFLKQLAEEDLDAARKKLMDLLSSYVSFTKTELTLVFDAYRVHSNSEKVLSYDGYTVVFTAENETADTYIEKMMHKLGPDYQIRVVTSDLLIQVSALHSGVSRISSREFIEELIRVGNEITAYLERIREIDSSFK